MSRSKDKIEKALNRKGYQSTYLEWTPVRRGPEMCGPEGGWYVEIEVMPDMKETGRFTPIVLGYSTNEVLDEVAKLPDCILDEEKDRSGA